MSFTHRYVRVVNSGKIEDRFLTLQVTRAEEAAKFSYGTIFNLIEITSRWFPTSQIAQSIVNSLRREYFKGASTSDLENFENALKKVNEHLATITQNGETEWIGNLHAALVLLNGNEAHICSSGNVRTLLIREGKVVPITQPHPTEEETPPLKTFSTITSGTLHDKDRIFIASSSLFDHLETQDLKDSFNENQSVFQAGTDLVRQLQKQKVKNVNFGIVEILSEPSASSRPVGEPEVIYIDQPVETTLKIAWRLIKTYLLPAAAKTAVIAKKTASQTQHTIKTYLIPASAKLASKLQYHGKIAASQIIEKTKPIATKIATQAKERVKIKLPEKPVEKVEEVSEGESLIGKTIFSIHDYSQAKPKKRLAIPLPSSLGWQRFVLFVRAKRNRPLVYIVITLILIFILVISISIQKKNEKAALQREQPKTALDDARRRLEEGKTALIFNNKQEAQLAFADSIKAAKTASANSKLKDEAKKIVDEAESQLDKLVGSNRLKNLNSPVTFNKAQNIAVVAGKVVAIGQAVALGDLVDGQMREISGVDGKPVAVTATADSAFVLTDLAIYKLDPNKSSAEKVSLADDSKIQKGIDLGEFFGNFYVLSPNDNQIWKYQGKDGVLQKQTPFIKGGTKITGAMAMTIDGSVYLIDDNGKVLKFSQGNFAQFGLTGLPKGLDKIEKPVTIFTHADSSSIYIVESGSLPRILEFDKQGKFLQQFLFQSDLSDLKDVWFQPTGRKAWALFGNSVYELNL